ncbi:MAG: UvrB/UvrC motif-containing protein [Candidatus Omnitrophica bacterium]|nr:UvrB/UvrC motif-containing protein [Candidatus Omnitrophota bacterium]
MICNVCGANEATIHLTEIVNDQMVEIHLCEACAQEKGTEFKTHFNVNDLLSGFTDLAKELTGADEKTVSLKCQNCGLTYDEFGRTGRLGCAECYEAFSKLLLPLIKRVQHSLQHRGKRPSQVAHPVVRTTQSLKDLQNRLTKLIQHEEFEEAARLRDQIKQLEEKLKKGKKKPQ